MNKNTFITYITHTRKTIFKAYKKAEKKFYFFFLYIKKTNNSYQKNQRNNSKMDCENYQYLSEEEHDKKCQYARKQYQNLSEEKKRSVNMVVNKKKIF